MSIQQGIFYHFVAFRLLEKKIVFMIELWFINYKNINLESGAVSL